MRSYLDSHVVKTNIYLSSQYKSKFYEVNTLFENMFMEFIQNLSQEGPPLHLLEPQAAKLSSMGSMTGLGTWYPVDDITVDTPCRLHIPLGRVENKTKEVVIGVAVPRHVFHNNPTPTEYAKVLVKRSLTWDMLIIHWTMSCLRESRSLDKMLISSYF
jgi:hypothetical protein